MNLSPFDTNMKCSSKYMSPINIDMKTNTDIYQCTNTSYLKFRIENIYFVKFRLENII